MLCRPIQGNFLLPTQRGYEQLNSVISTIDLELPGIPPLRTDILNVFYDLIFFPTSCWAENIALTGI